MPERELQNGLPGSTEQDLRQAIARKTVFLSVAQCAAGQQLLKYAHSELGIHTGTRQRILAVARTIANLDERPHIEPQHLSEAINYRLLSRA